MKIVLVSFKKKKSHKIQAKLLKLIFSEILSTVSIHKNAFEVFMEISL